MVDKNIFEFLKDATDISNFDYVDLGTYSYIDAYDLYLKAKAITEPRPTTFDDKKRVAISVLDQLSKTQSKGAVLAGFGTNRHLEYFDNLFGDGETERVLDALEKYGISTDVLTGVRSQKELDYEDQGVRIVQHVETNSEGSLVVEYFELWYEGKLIYRYSYYGDNEEDVDIEKRFDYYQHKYSQNKYTKGAFTGKYEYKGDTRYKVFYSRTGKEYLRKG